MKGRKRKVRKANGEQHERKKPGPHEQLHTLAPLTFNEALDKLLAARPKDGNERKKKA